MMKNLILKAYVNASTALESFSKKENGVTAIEYAIVVAGVAAIVLVVFGSSGPVASALNSTFSNLSDKLSSLLS